MEQLLLAALGTLMGIILMFIKYVLGRFSALESQIIEDRKECIKSPDMRLHVGPIQDQLNRMNAQLDKLMDLQLAQSRGDTK